MNINNKHFRTIWVKEDNENVIQIIDQRSLPHQVIIEDLLSVDDVAVAIDEMHVRGAGLIGAAAGYGMYLAALEAPKDNHFDQYVINAGKKLINTRPTAVNLFWAVEKQLKAIEEGKSIREKIVISYRTAEKIANDDIESCKKIGDFG